MGEMSTIFLYSQRVVPTRATALGFSFDVHWAADALAPAARPAARRTPEVARARQTRRRPISTETRRQTHAAARRASETEALSARSPLIRRDHELLRAAAKAATGIRSIPAPPNLVRRRNL